MSDLQTSVDSGPMSKYFSMMLHIDDDDLDPFEYKLLGHYRKVCGLSRTGECTESIATTAELAQMSIAKVREARRSLSEKGCITENNDLKSAARITIEDRMSENVQRYQQTPLRKRAGGVIEFGRGGVSNSIAKKELEELEKDSMRESLSLSRRGDSEDENAGEASTEQARDTTPLTSQESGATTQERENETPPSKVPLKVSPPDPSHAPASNGEPSLPPGSNGNKPKREKPKLPPTYGDLFVTIRTEIYKGSDKSPYRTQERAGQDAKKLLADYPDADATELKAFIAEYKKRKPNMDLPRNGNLCVWFETWRLEWKPKVDEWIVIPHPDPTKAALGIMKEIRRSEVAL